jgi:CheY-like chemotaxis protein
LVVDDDPLSRSHAREIVEKLGYRMTDAGSTDEAYLLLALDGIDVVLADIEMPGPVNGLQLARHISSRWPHVAVVLMSEQTLPNPADVPKDARVLTKPISPQRLIDVLGESS